MPAVSRSHLHLLFGLALFLYLSAFFSSTPTRSILGLVLGIALCGLWFLWMRGIKRPLTSIAFAATAFLGYITADWVSSAAMQIMAILLLLLSLGRSAALIFLALIIAITAAIHIYAGSEPSKIIRESLGIGTLVGFGYALAAQIQYGMNLNAQLREQIALKRDLLLSRERERLAQSLHDGLSHRLIAIILSLDLSQRLLADQESPAKKELSQARRLAGGALDDMRATVRAMTPIELQEGDLLHTLRTVADSFSSTSLAVHVRGSANPPEDVSLLALRFTQEALSNVVRHSDAGEITITVNSQPGRFTIQALDDGSPTAPQTSGYGIASLRRRAQEYGGTVQALPQPRGFLLRMEVPCA
ncbi:sensor histidine kinase [Corynebacterium lowii]|uniref:Sensor histidine kinase LiaS n=1 Tax=Corynebacterium lowii TaxID=1544413 RepID=A0A0N8W088_9CORY|nr:histidine kinase [Corynebacterium lowii]KQB86018.1 Sensor histidine kinase LiaS [Corynebacterium lowii]MDP9850551.1 signal transduction histidine kinase [Corynebacterium lowii]